VTLQAEIETLRGAAGLTRLDHVAGLRIEGKDAFAILDLLSTRPLFLREGQIGHSLFLREDAGLFADAFVCFGEDAFYVLCEGPSQSELLAYVQAERARRLPGADASVEGLSEGFELLGVNGPYAWEVVAELLGPSVLGMPYLTLMHVEAGLCLRAGKTGEYGYDLLVRRQEAAALGARLREVGEPLGLREVSLAALDQCGLENWHFSMRTLRETRFAVPLTPFELQLQWRVGYDREFVGAAALRARRVQPGAMRATSFRAAAEVAAGDLVRLGQDTVGELLAAGYSCTRGEWVGMALLPRALAHPRIAVLAVARADRLVPIETMAPPLINNLSLHVDPHRHSYRTREKERFPELVVG